MQKFYSVATWFNTMGSIFKIRMYHACMVTWYSEITSCKRSSWLHDGHVVCQHSFILDMICRATNIIHSHFPTLQNVSRNQNLSLPLSSLFLYRHSSLSSQQPVSIFLPATQQPAAVSQPPPAFIQQAVSKQQPAIIQSPVDFIQQHPSSNQESSSHRHLHY